VAAPDLTTPASERTWESFSPLGELREMDWGTHAGPIVVVAPHPDDETLGLGGTLHQLAATGRPLKLLAITEGEASHPNSRTLSPAALAARRAEERLRALRCLGCEQATVVSLGEPDGGVRASAQLIARIAEHLRSASWCLATYRSDGHPDHDAAGEAAAAAASSLGVPFGEYLIWTWQLERPDSNRVPWTRARRVTLDETAQRAKARALAEFQSQIAPLSSQPGDEAILSDSFLGHFRREFEVILT
jgi:LmbE family N-acetylglucosaminyl deacetylase